MKKIKQQIRKVFKEHKELKEKPVLDINNHSENLLTYFGYPELKMERFVFTDIILKKFTEKKRIFFPDRCCVCMREASVFLSAIEYSGLFGINKNIRLKDCVPHCENHGKNRFAKLGVILYSCPYSSKKKSFTLIGSNMEFLTETKRMNLLGDIFPPWIVYPGIESHSGYWRQGVGENMISNIWRPFWKNLSLTERKEYIEKWKPNQDWMGYIEMMKEWERDGKL